VRTLRGEFVERGLDALEPLLLLAREPELARDDTFLENVDGDAARGDGLPIGRLFGHDGRSNAQSGRGRKHGGLWLSHSSEAVIQSRKASAPPAAVAAFIKRQS